MKTRQKSPPIAENKQPKIHYGAKGLHDAASIAPDDVATRTCYLLEYLN
jgi:hypothetical protein